MRRPHFKAFAINQLPPDSHNTLCLLAGYPKSLWYRWIGFYIAGAERAGIRHGDYGLCVYRVLFRSLFLSIFLRPGASFHGRSHGQNFGFAQSQNALHYRPLCAWRTSLSWRCWLQILRTRSAQRASSGMKRGEINLQFLDLLIRHAGHFPACNQEVTSFRLWL